MDGGEETLLISGDAKGPYREWHASEAHESGAGGKADHEEEQSRPQRYSHGTYGERRSTLGTKRLSGSGGPEAERRKQNLEPGHLGILPLVSASAGTRTE